MFSEKTTKTKLAQIAYTACHKPPRPRPLMFIGRHNGQKCYCVKKNLPIQQLRKKYPAGVVPRWKVNIIKIVDSGRFKGGSPWFSDVLTKIMSFVVR